MVRLVVPVKPLSQGALLIHNLEKGYNEGMEDAIRLAVENSRKLNNNQRRAFNVRINGEEHSAQARKGTATIHFPVDGQLMQISELAFKLIINDGERAGGSSDPTNDPYHNWSYGLKTYKSLDEWLARYPVGSSVDVDGYHSCQCWDYQAAFWTSQVNRGFFTGPQGYVYEAWTVSQERNKGTEFDLIYNWKDLRPGDWIIWGTNGPGHDALALECPSSSSSPIRVRDQNGPQGMVIGDNVYGPQISNGNTFLGAFRYKYWTVPGCGTLV